MSDGPIDPIAMTNARNELYLAAVWLRDAVRQAEEARVGNGNVIRAMVNHVLGDIGYELRRLPSSQDSKGG